MPIYSDPGYYYSGGGYHQMYSPYYTSSPYSSAYSGYSRALGGTYIVPSSRVNLSSSRYHPKLSTISESPLSARKNGMIPLTRIHSPKVSYHNSPHFKPPRPIPISTADIDVSASRYRKREKSQESEESKAPPAAKPNEESDCNNNSVQDSSPFMPRVDGTDPAIYHRSTIKRDRPIVRLSIMHQESKDSQKRDSPKEDKTKKQPSVKKKKTDELKAAEKQENLSWRDRFGDDLLPRRQGSPRKSPGEILLERYLIRDKQKQDVVEVATEVAVEPPIGFDPTIRRLSLPKPPSFHDICEDISSDKIDDDLNAGALRRRASIIQEQEAEIINQLQKSASGTFHLILERCESEDDCRKSVKRKSKKGKKVRHKITATVQVDNSPLTAIIQEVSEDNEAVLSPVESKLKANVEKIEEDHTVHKIFKLPKKKPKPEVEEISVEKVEEKKDSSEKSSLDTKKNQDVKKVNKVVPSKLDLSSGKMNKKEAESQSTLKSQPSTNTVSPTPSIQSPKSAQILEDVKSTVQSTKEVTGIKSPISVQSPIATTPIQSPSGVSSPTEAQSPTGVKSPRTVQLSSELQTPCKTPASVKSPMAILSTTKVQSPTEFWSPTNVKSPSSNKKSSKPEYFTFDVDATKTQVPANVGTPKSPKTPKFAVQKETDAVQRVAKPKPIVKIQKSNSGEDFWAQIGTRETMYMNKRKMGLLEQQWTKRESLFENQEVVDSNEENKLNEIKQKIGSQKAEVLKEADDNMSKKTGLKRSESNESALKEVLEKEPSKEKAPLPEKDSKAPVSLPSIKKEETTTDKASTKIENKLKSKSSEIVVKTTNKQETSTKKRVSDKTKNSPKVQSPLGLETPKGSQKGDEPPLGDSKEKLSKMAPVAVKTPEITPPSPKPLSETISGNAKALQRTEPKINIGLKAKSPEISSEQDNRNIKDDQIPSAEENVGIVKKISPQNKIKKSKSQDRKEESEQTAKTRPATSFKKSDVNRFVSEESGRKEENVEEKAKQQSKADHQQNDKIRTKETRSRKEDEKLIVPEKQPKGLDDDQQQNAITPGVRAPPAQSDVKLSDQSQLERSPIILTAAANQKSHESDKNEKIFGGDINDASKSSEVAKDELIRDENDVCTLSKYPTVSDLNRCLRDVDADLSDYIPSEEDSTYDSSEHEGDNMKKKNRDKIKEEKFNPNKAIKLDHKKKCYVKEEAPPYPLVATPRPLWKREKFNYKSDSESEESESESECSTTEESGDELHPNKDNIIRMSTCSNDSGFEGGTAPSCPKKMLETSYTFAQFQKSGRITAPATIIPRFKKYSVEDFHFLAVLGKGSFGKVLLAELRNTEYYYAVKCLKKDVVLEDDDVECTLIERKVLALGTKHPYLCHLFCTFQSESHLFFVMEYLNGGDLMFHIQQSGRFPEARARFYAAEIISGLKFLHKKGIIYRDLKLDNVLLDFDGHVRIADFGMCKLQIYLDKTADSFCGTPDYMAPEIIKGEKYNQNVDWWSFGVLLYEMLIGQSPFSGCDEDELFWSICNEIPWFPIFISQEATNILKGLLEKDSAGRIGSQYSPAGDICSHPFFNEIDWQRLERRELDPPFKPQVKHPLDTQYFDKAFTRERVRLTPIDKEILQSMDQEQFQGFSYTNPNATLN